MVIVQALAGVLETVIGQAPDPRHSIGNDQRPGGLAQTAPQRFGVQLFPQGVDPFARRDKAPLADYGPPAVWPR